MIQERDGRGRKEVWGSGRREGYRQDREDDKVTRRGQGGGVMYAEEEYMHQTMLEGAMERGRRARIRAKEYRRGRG